jgi:hypothetical protein
MVSNHDRIPLLLEVCLVYALPAARIGIVTLEEFSEDASM